MHSIVISIFLYNCESWTLTAELEKRTQAFKKRCYQRLLNISYKDHVTNEEVRSKTQAAIGTYDIFLESNMKTVHILLASKKGGVQTRPGVQKRPRHTYQWKNIHVYFTNKYNMNI